MAIVWVVLAAVLLAVELQHLALYACFAALGAAAAAIVAVVAPSAVVAQVVVAVVVAGLGIVAARPFVSRVVHRRSDGHVALGVHGGLVGERQRRAHCGGCPGDRHRRARHDARGLADGRARSRA